MKSNVSFFSQNILHLNSQFFVLQCKHQYVDLLHILIKIPSGYSFCQTTIVLNDKKAS